MMQSETSDSGHMALVTSTRRARDWFRLRYWVRCWECDLRRGPYASRVEAENCRRHAEQGFR